MAKAIWNNTVIAESDDTIVIENNHYFPSDAVKLEYLKESGTETTCVWKGQAHYYDIVVGDQVNKDAAWYYPDPKEGSVEKVGADFTNYIAFWRGVDVTD